MSRCQGTRPIAVVLTIERVEGDTIHLRRERPGARSDDHRRDKVVRTHSEVSTRKVASSILMVALWILLIAPAWTWAAGVYPLFDLTAPATSPFPTDRFTVPDATQLTRRRVALPLPDCADLPSDCADISVLNTLDGFNVQPRLSIPFSGPIDVATATSQSIVLVRLGDVTGGGAPAGQVSGISQVVWDPATNTLHVESDQTLDQHTLYALVVTDGVKDTAGDPVQASEEWTRFRRALNFGQSDDDAIKAYRKVLLDPKVLLSALEAAGVAAEHVVVASLFTTQSVTAVLEKIRDQIRSAPAPAPADFLLAPGPVRTVFPVAGVSDIVACNQTRATPPALASPCALPGTPGVNVFSTLKSSVPGAVGHVGFGKYLSPDYLTADLVIPPTGTLTGAPAVQPKASNGFTGFAEVHFTVVLPDPAFHPKPAAGYPVAIYAHGGGDNKHVVNLTLAPKLAEFGIATITINLVGHGFGPGGFLIVSPSPSGPPILFPSGGRGFDQDGDLLIGNAEGSSTLAGAPFAIMRHRDTMLQTVADLLQLIRVIEGGMDVDGDFSPDLDPARIYVWGRSQGGRYGGLLIAVEPRVRAGVLGVAGGSQMDYARLASPRSQVLKNYFGFRTPSLLNVGSPASDFDDDIPLRGDSPVTSPIAGALALQEAIERHEWASQASEIVPWAHHLQAAPLGGGGPKPMIVQFARGDKSLPNPTTTALLRAGGLAGVATLFRYDLAFGLNPTLYQPTWDPHGFSHGLGPADTGCPLRRQIALATQEQVAVFFASDGASIIDPDTVMPRIGTCTVERPLFETPIAPPLPEDLGFVP